MDTRRSFLKKAGLLSGGAAFIDALPLTLQRALAIDPAPGSTFYDAEHIVFLMQENRSFDHALGTLQGVRGFNDPRAINLPNRNKVWLQTDKKGDTYAPFHLDIKNTKITWMGSLPHAWSDQVDARNGGLYDKWLDAKAAWGDYEGMPLTMGYYSRADIPFYYALADAFTVCDHNFCSALTGTTPNRLYFWSGTIREKMNAAAQANVWNENADHGSGEVAWKSYPERLEDHGISWKVYQNEIYADVGLGEAQGWLDNFGDNPLEYFTQYNIKLHPEYIAYIPEKIKKFKKSIAEQETKIRTEQPKDEKEKKGWEEHLAYLQKRLRWAEEEQVTCTKERFDALSPYAKRIHEKAFTNNRKDTDYHAMTQLTYHDGKTEREIDIPKGDILQQFREDVKNGQLPTVSWIAAPEKFSDHPSAAWFGAWYLSEVIDILTQNPEVWKKTIFVLTYDENDGYFDHLPPFASPNPYKANSGKVSPGIDTTVEYVRMNEQSIPDYARESNIGLGYRVPMIIASPWTRGGYVCSEVFDHTSSLRFLEKFLERKTGKKITEENITQWRRTVCGDLSSAFRPYNGEKISKPAFIEKEKFIEMINNAQFKEVPDNFTKLKTEQIAAINTNSPSSTMPKQEKGIRSACALPYELYADGNIRKDRSTFAIKFRAGNKVFGEHAAGSPFYVYDRNDLAPLPLSVRNYALAAGDELEDEWTLGAGEAEAYHFNVHGPNGFFRSFKGNGKDPLLDIRLGYDPVKGAANRLSGHAILTVTNNDTRPVKVEIVNNKSYGNETFFASSIAPGKTASVVVNTKNSFGWYDVLVRATGYASYSQQFAGHVESGAVSKTDPLMGGVAQ